MKEGIHGYANKTVNRFYKADTKDFRQREFPHQIKEKPELVSVVVLRCNDCIKYHSRRSHNPDITIDGIFEEFANANLVGSKIVIPHIRQTVEYRQR